MKQREWLRARLLARDTVWSAGAYDALSAKLIQAAGFEALLTTGFGISAAHLGQPDVELYTMTENLNVVRLIVNAVDIPVIADCDTGYGNAVNVMRTVREFERAGVAALILEDQVVPKRCPVIVNEVEVLPREEAVAKIRAAVEARQDPDLVIIARTDAGTEAEAIARAQAFVAAGADMVQPISKTFRNTDMLRRFAAAAGAPVSLQVLGWLEDLSPEVLRDLSGMATFPLVPLMTAVAALRTNLTELRRTLSTGTLQLPRTNPAEFADLLGFAEIQDVQARFLPASLNVPEKLAV